MKELQKRKRGGKSIKIFLFYYYFVFLKLKNFRILSLLAISMTVENESSYQINFLKKKNFFNINKFKLKKVRKIILKI